MKMQKGLIRKTRLVLVAALISLPLMAAYSQAKVMKIGMVTAKERSLSKGCVYFGELLEKYSKGAIKVEVFTDGVLGGDTQVLQALQINSVQATAVSTGPVASFAPRMSVFDLPYLFKDKKSAYRVFDGPIGTEMLQDLPAAKMVGLAYWENGFRHLTNNRRAVTKMSDIKGLKIRTLENQLHIKLWRTLGANPTPMAFSQLYSGLEQGVVDGQENPYGNVVSSKFFEVQKYLTNTGHIYNANIFLVSKIFWDSLSATEQAAVQKAATEARDYQRDLNEKEDQESVAILTKNGMKISDLAAGEKEKIQKALEPLYTEASATIPGGIVERVIAAANAK
jgi:tripartite ATP-independent transporter DctP family solute receptor